MQYISAIIALAAIAVQAGPAAIPKETLKLYNCDSHITTTTAARSVTGLEARGANKCSGSAYCNNGSSLKEAVAEVVKRVNTDPSDKGGYGMMTGTTGVCDGDIGLFVDGDTCFAKGPQLVDAYNKILENGCETCGWVNYPDFDGDDATCQIKMDWVASC